MRMKFLDELDATGRTWFRSMLAETVLSDFDNLFFEPEMPGQRIRLGDISNDVSSGFAALTKLAKSLAPNAMPVRVLTFNKTAEENWLVPWHQDRVIAVWERYQVDGFSNWSRKSGVWHVEPPLKILEDMFFARVHLDDTDADNGCLELSLGSHRNGKVDSAEARSVAGAAETEICAAYRGDVLFVKALALHRSNASNSIKSRRVVRVDFSAEQLPAPLSWAV